MLSLIGRLGEFGINVLVSSHVLTDIETTCDWVVMLDGGRVLRSGPLTGITGSDTVDVELLGDGHDVIAALQKRGAEVEVRGAVLRVRSKDDAFDLIRDALAEAGAGMKRLSQSETSLEDIFLAEGGAE